MLGALGADLKSDCWMIVNEENLLSVKAIEGVGFTRGGWIAFFLCSRCCFCFNVHDYVYWRVFFTSIPYPYNMFNLLMLFVLCRSFNKNKNLGSIDEHINKWFSLCSYSVVA